MFRGGLFSWMLMVVTALAFAGRASADKVAAEEPAAGHENHAAPPNGEGGHGAHGGADEGPFAGPANRILDLAIWTVVVFLILLFVLGRYAWKPMLAGLQKREEHIRSALAEAQAAHEEAKRIQVQLQQQLASAHEQVRQILDEGRRDAEKLRETEMARTAAEIQTERDRLRHEIETQTAQAVQHIWSQAAELATLASAKALGRGITEDGHRRLIDEALSEIRESVGGANGHA
jgi:F-type H+-transporting ATPase subunit b